MKAIEVQELESHLSGVLREVESGQTIEVMRHGQVIARVAPAQQTQQVRPLARDENDAWAKLDALIDEIAADWPEGVSAQDAINDVQRKLQDNRR